MGQSRKLELNGLAGDGFAIPTVGLFVLVAVTSVIAGMPPPCRG